MWGLACYMWGLAYYMWGLACYMWGLACYSHVENACITASFDKEGGGGVLAHKTSLIPPFSQVPLSVCTKPWKWVVMYLRKGYRFCLFLRFFYLILQMFRQWGIFSLLVILLGKRSIKCHINIFFLVGFDIHRYYMSWWKLFFVFDFDTKIVLVLTYSDIDTSVN